MKSVKSMNKIVLGFYTVILNISINHFPYLKYTKEDICKNHCFRRQIANFRYRRAAEKLPRAPYNTSIKNVSNAPLKAKITLPVFLIFFT